jgi:hypothetical protein
LVGFAGKAVKNTSSDHGGANSQNLERAMTLF